MATFLDTIRQAAAKVVSDKVNQIKGVASNVTKNVLQNTPGANVISAPLFGKPVATPQPAPQPAPQQQSAASVMMGKLTQPLVNAAAPVTQKFETYQKLNPTPAPQPLPPTKTGTPWTISGWLAPKKPTVTNQPSYITAPGVKHPEFGAANATISQAPTLPLAFKAQSQEEANNIALQAQQEEAYRNQQDAEDKGFFGSLKQSLPNTFAAQAPVNAIQSITQPFRSAANKLGGDINQLAPELDQESKLRTVADTANTAYEGAKLFYGAGLGGTGKLAGTLQALGQPTVIGGAAQALPEEAQGLVRPAMEAYSVLSQPTKELSKIAGLNVLLGRADQPISDAINEGSYSQPTKDMLNLGLNLLENLVAVKGAKAEANLNGVFKPAVQEGYRVYKETGDLEKAMDTTLMVRDMITGRAGHPTTIPGTSEVLGYTTLKQKGVDIVQPKFEDLDIKGKQQNLERLLGLAPTTDGTNLEGAKGLGTLTGGIRKAKNAVVGALVGKDNVGDQGLLETLTSRARDKSQALASSALTKGGVAGGLTKGLKAFAGKTGVTQEHETARGLYKGRVALANDLTRNVSEKVYDLTNKDPASLAKIHAVLDPELYKGNKEVSREPLTRNEQQAVDVLRASSDLINDVNYKNGFISKAQWSKNKGGQYIARAYKPFDFEPSIQAKKLGVKSFDPVDLGMFKNRKELDSWMKDNAIQDPAWLMSKRIHETLTNDAVKKYYSWVAENPEYVSDIPKPGFTKMELFQKGGNKERAIDGIIQEKYGDLPIKDLRKLRSDMMKMSDNELMSLQKGVYGDLSGKFVRQDILEDVRGFYYTNQVAQSIYDVLKAYNSWAPRVALKKSKTVYNPVVRMGNRFGGMVFANFMGVNPVSFMKEYAGVKENSSLWRALQAQGVLGTDYAKNEIRKTAADIATPPKEKGAFSKLLNTIDEKVTSGYSKVDDKGKVATAQVLLNRGYSFDYVVNQLRQGMQDYSVVGKAFDVSSKLPVFGKPFGKFLSNATMIMKNAMINRPIRTIGTLALMKAIADASSDNSGESEEDRKTRENRIGASHVPFSDLFVEGGVPLSIQTPLGEINVGRMFGLQSLNTERGVSSYDDIAGFLPFEDTPTSDVLSGPALTAAGALYGMHQGEQNSLEKDFRGKSIRDPSLTPFQKDSYLPVQDQLYNIGSSLVRSYAPQQVSDAWDISKASQGKEDYYGRNKTVPQALSRALGFKVEQFNHPEAVASRERQQTYDDKQAAGQASFDLKYTIQKAVSNNAFNEEEFNQVKKADVQRQVYVTNSELEKAKKQEKYAGWDEENIRKVLMVNSLETSIRNTNSKLIDNMIEEGRKNRASREMLDEKIKELVKESASTYDSPKDVLHLLETVESAKQSKWGG